MITLVTEAGSTRNSITFVGALTGNASSDVLQTAGYRWCQQRGLPNINLPGVNAAGNQFTSGNAATATAAATATNVTVSANNSTNETVYPVFVDGATGAQGAGRDTGLTYNPSTGNLTATKFTGDDFILTGISRSGGVTESSGMKDLHYQLQVQLWNFVGSGVVASGNGATKTITIAGNNNPGFSTCVDHLINSGVTTVVDTFNINTNTKLSEYTIHHPRKCKW